VKKSKKLLIIIFSFFILINVLAYIHAYKFTHFSSAHITRTKGPDELDWQEKLAILLTGVTNPKPLLTHFPAKKYETIRLVKTDTLEGWDIPTATSAKGVVLLFHGYAGCKSDMLKQSEVFNSLGYNCILVDFSGSGGSSGTKTTLGVEEAEEVQTWVNFAAKKNPSIPMYLYGVSMGAVSILRAAAISNLPVKGLLLECPFESMLSAIKNRFDIMGIPSFFSAELLAFWGGIQNGFWAFSHNSVHYAKKINCPTILFYGLKDRKVTMEETQNIYSSLAGNKKLVTFPKAGHDNSLLLYKNKWTDAVTSFLNQNNF